MPWVCFVSVHSYWPREQNNYHLIRLKIFAMTDYFYFSLHRLRNIKGMTESLSMSLFFLLSTCLFSFYVCEDKPVLCRFVNEFYKSLNLQLLDKSFICPVITVGRLEVLWQWAGWRIVAEGWLWDLSRMVLTDWSNRDAGITGLCHAGQTNEGLAVLATDLIIIYIDHLLKQSNIFF